MASACGHVEMVTWLLEQPEVMEGVNDQKAADIFIRALSRKNNEKVVNALQKILYDSKRFKFRYSFVLAKLEGNMEKYLNLVEIDMFNYFKDINRLYKPEYNMTKNEWLFLR